MEMMNNSYDTIEVGNSLFRSKYYNNDILAKAGLSKKKPSLFESEKIYFKFSLLEDVKSAHSKKFKTNWYKVLFGDLAKDKRSTLVSKLNSYLSLSDDWDGYGGVAPNKETVDDAMRLLHLLPNHISIPKPMLGNLGTIGYYWDKGNLYAEICFDGDQTFWYYAKIDNIEIGDEDVSLNANSLPVKLISVLKRF